MDGGISLKELGDMPYSQYRCLRKAIELEMLRKRIVYIYDTYSAVNSPKQQITFLEKEYNKLRGNSIVLNLEESKSDENWEARIKRFAR